MRFRYPRDVLVVSIIGVPLFVLTWGGFLVIMLLTMLGAIPDIFDQSLRAQDALLILAIYVVVSIVSVGTLLTKRRIEREDRQKTITFIQRTFDAELIEPSSVTGVADVR